VEKAEIKQELIVDGKGFITAIRKSRMGGACPLYISEGWFASLLMAWRNTGGPFALMCIHVYDRDLSWPWRITYKPGGQILVAPHVRSE